MAETQVTKTEEQAVQTAQAPETETTYVPDVDISENNECIRLVADMPGVDQKSVDVTVENNVLTVEGHAQVEAPRGTSWSARSTASASTAGTSRSRMPWIPRASRPGSGTAFLK